MHSIKIEIKHEKQLIMVNLHLYEGRTSRTREFNSSWFTSFSRVYCISHSFLCELMVLDNVPEKKKILDRLVGSLSKFQYLSLV